MHEASLIRSLLSQVQTLATEHGGGDQCGQFVQEIRIEIGPLTGVEPLLVRSAFEQLGPEQHFTGTRLVIDEVPLVARCASCGDFEVQRYRFECPTCGSPHVVVQSGDEFRLISISLSDHLAPPDAT